MKKYEIKNRLNSLIIFFIGLLIIVIFGLAFARYLTILTGETEAPIAKWNFNVTVGESENLNVNLAQTRLLNDNNETASNKVSPGTKGAFVLKVDAEDSQVSLSYEIIFSLSGIPENLKFYSDEELTKPLSVKDGKVRFYGYIAHSGTPIKEIPIYWEWPMETGNTQEEIDNNDELDSEWIGQDIILAIKGEGKQVLEDPTNGVGSFTLAKNSISLTPYEYEQIEITNLSQLDWVEDYRFSSSDNQVATVDESGKITGVASGNVTITITGLQTGETKTISVAVAAGGPIIYDNGTPINLRNFSTQAEVGKYYGTTIANIDGIDYGLFYVDYDGTFSGGDSGKGTIYLKAKGSVGILALNSVSEVNVNDVSRRWMKQINPQWANSDRANLNYSQLAKSEKSAIFLCDENLSLLNSAKTNFTTKYGEKLRYVIGGSGVELFFASFRAKYPTQQYTARFFYGITDEKATELTSSYDYSGYLYSINNGKNYSHHYSDKIDVVETMYKNNSYRYWLASPLGFNNDGSICAIGNSGSLDHGFWSGGFSVTPLVSLKSDVSFTE